MLAGRPFQRVRAFEGVWPKNLHLPSVTSLRANNQHLPLPRSIREHVFDTCHHFPLQLEIARIVHLDSDRHTESVRQVRGRGCRWLSDLRYMRHGPRTAQTTSKRFLTNPPSSANGDQTRSAHAADSRALGFRDRRGPRSRIRQIS